MKAISLWQPYATAIALKLKRYETRHWWTDYRGPLAIHAAKTDNKQLRDFFANQVMCCELKHHFDKAHFYSWTALPKGAIVCVVNLTNCEPTKEVVRRISQYEMLLGDYGAGRFAWTMDDVQMLQQPLHVRGHQSFFEVDDKSIQSCLSPRAEVGTGFC